MQYVAAWAASSFLFFCFVFVVIFLWFIFFEKGSLFDLLERQAIIWLDEMNNGLLIFLSLCFKASSSVLPLKNWLFFKLFFSFLFKIAFSILACIFCGNFFAHLIISLSLLIGNLILFNLITQIDFVLGNSPSKIIKTQF